jgi:AcrR family transcriptional regulator
MESAAEVFLRKGYLGTSVDEIAAQAGVSKQTVYKHFTDKERLFTDVVLGTIDQMQERFGALTIGLEHTEDVERDLRNLARRLVTLVIRPELAQLRRIVIGEFERFPEVARTWYEQGPQRVVTTLAPRLEQLSQRGLLRIDDPLLAAQHFNWLVLSIPLNGLMFGVPEEPYTQADLERFADEAVRVFLAAYRA